MLTDYFYIVVSRERRKGRAFWSCKARGKAKLQEAPGACVSFYLSQGWLLAS